MTDLFSLTADMGDLEEGSLPPVEKWNPPFCGPMDMRIRRDGVWFHEGTPIGRAKLVRLFASILIYEPGEARYCLVTPVEKVEITVEDAPFVAIEMDVSGIGDAQVLTFKTSVGDHTTIDKDHPLVFRPDAENEQSGMVPYVMVRRGLDARFVRTVYYQLAELAVPDLKREGHYVIWSSGTAFDFPVVEMSGEDV